LGKHFVEARIQSDMVRICKVNLSNIAMQNGNIIRSKSVNPVFRFLPQDTYLFKYFETRDKYFPGRGYNAMVIMSNVTLHSNLPELDQLVQNLTSSKSVYDVDAWFPDFKSYVNKNFGTGE